MARKKPTKREQKRAKARKVDESKSVAAPVVPEKQLPQTPAAHPRQPRGIVILELRYIGASGETVRLGCPVPFEFVAALRNLKECQCRNVQAFFADETLGTIAESLPIAATVTQVTNGRPVKFFLFALRSQQ